MEIGGVLISFKYPFTSGLLLEVLDFNELTRYQEHVKPAEFGTPWAHPREASTAEEYKNSNKTPNYRTGSWKAAKTEHWEQNENNETTNYILQAVRGCLDDSLSPIKNVIYSLKVREMKLDIPPLQSQTPNHSRPSTLLKQTKAGN
ncbi:hypothetical protein LXL04_026562 [Taraxacum kok-saghyz]